MAVVKNQDTAGAEHKRVLHTMNLIRIIVLVLALTALVIFFIKIGVDPASAGKKSGH